MGRAQQAVQYLAAVANQGWKDPRVFSSLGHCYFSLGKFKASSEAFRSALEFGTAGPENLLLYAHALSKLGRVEEAEYALREALKLKPDCAPAYDLLGFLLPQIGKFEEGKQAALRAVELEPENSAFAARMVFAGRLERSETGVLDRLEKIAVKRDLATPERIRVEYALGKGWEDLGSYEKSLGHFLKANDFSFQEQKRAGNGFDASAHRKEIDFLVAQYPGPESFQLDRPRSLTDKPVFIVGMMRSGTTLTEQILSSHPEVAGAGELDYWIRMAPLLLNANESFINKAAQDYIRILDVAGPNSSRVCDKMPQNYMSIGPLHATFPNARFIHCRRDPRDTCFSIFTIPFTHHPPSAYSMKNIASTYREYKRLMAHWRKVIPKDRLMEVDYENLVENPERESRRLIEFLGLSWSDACLFPEKNERVISTPSRWQVRQPVYRSSVGRWKRFEPFLSESLVEWKWALDL
jgi:tetratricopeptide (TPR) repeat protein